MSHLYGAVHAQIQLAYKCLYLIKNHTHFVGAMAVGAYEVFSIDDSKKIADYLGDRAYTARKCNEMWSEWKKLRPDVFFFFSGPEIFFWLFWARLYMRIRLQTPFWSWGRVNFMLSPRTSGQN